MHGYHTAAVTGLCFYIDERASLLRAQEDSSFFFKYFILLGPFVRKDSVLFHSVLSVDLPHTDNYFMVVPTHPLGEGGGTHKLPLVAISFHGIQTTLRGRMKVAIRPKSFFVTMFFWAPSEISPCFFFLEVSF